MENEKMLVPKLRFSQFDKKWKRNKIQKLIDDNLIIGHLDGNHGELYPKSSEFTISGVPYVSANDFINGFVDFNKCKFLPVNRAKKFKKGIAINGDVLFAHNATVGPTAILKTELEYIILSTTATYFRCDNSKLINSYLRYYFDSYRFITQYRRIMGQSTRNQVPITAQRKLFVSLPLLKEQKKIANFLTSIDTQIQILEKKKSLLEQYKKGVMQKIFKQELRFKDENGEEFSEWNLVKLKEVFKRSKLKNTDEKVKYVLTNSATKGIISQNDYFDKDIANQNNLQGYYIVEKDDFIYNPRISQSAPVGPFKRNKLTQGVMSPLYTVLTSQKGNLEFFEFYFDTTLWHKYMKAIANYGARHDRMNITMTDFENLPIPYPSVKEQTKIADFLSAIDKNIAVINSKIEQTKTYKKGLLQQMFV